jgi:hypothetical protein
VFGLNFGESFLVIFITVAVVSARYWPLLGERIALRLSGHSTAHDDPSRSSTPGPPAS